MTLKRFFATNFPIFRKSLDEGRKQIASELQSELRSVIYLQTETKIRKKNMIKN